MEPLTEFPERILPGQTIFVGQKHHPVKIVNVRQNNRVLLLTLEGYTDREQVGMLRNEEVFITGEALPALEEGRFYHHQLLGLNVMDESGALLGRLEEVLETGANDVYVVRPPQGPEILLPAIESVILSVNLPRGEMIVRPLAWE